MIHNTYMYAHGHGWIVCTWDPGVACYRTSGEVPYAVARAAVGTDNCRRRKGTCDLPTHQHGPEEG